MVATEIVLALGPFAEPKLISIYWELLKRRYTFANLKVQLLFWFSVVIVLYSSTLGFQKFETPTNFHNHLSTNKLNSICAIEKYDSRDI